MAISHLAPAGVDDAVWEGAPAVVGTLDSGLRIERISGEARLLFNRPVDELIGKSLLVLVIEDDVTTCLIACAEAAASQRGVKVNLNVSTTTTEWGSEPLLCEVLILPLRPSPGCAFVLLPVPTPVLNLPDTEAIPSTLNRLGRRFKAPRVAPGVLSRVPDGEVAGVARLTTRELQIVSRLLDGHRPPSIARMLFLSQSTVRNHLSSVFKKLDVTSQEELLELFRVAPPSAVVPMPASALQAPFIDQDRLALTS